MRGSTAFTVAELEDRLALVDDRLSRIALEPNAPERAELLWRERVGVMQLAGPGPLRGRGRHLLIRRRSR